MFAVLGSYLPMEVGSRSCLQVAVFLPLKRRPLGSAQVHKVGTGSKIFRWVSRGNGKCATPIPTSGFLDWNLGHGRNSTRHWVLIQSTYIQKMLASALQGIVTYLVLQLLFTSPVHLQSSQLLQGDGGHGKTCKFFQRELIATFLWL